MRVEMEQEEEEEEKEVEQSVAALLGEEVDIIEEVEEEHEEGDEEEQQEGDTTEEEEEPQPVSGWRKSLEVVKSGWQRFRSRSRSPEKGEQQLQGDEEQDITEVDPQEDEDDEQEVISELPESEADEMVQRGRMSMTNFTPQRPQRSQRGSFQPFMTPQAPRPSGSALADRVRGIGRYSFSASMEGRGRGRPSQQPWKVKDIVVPLQAIQERRRSAFAAPDPFFGDQIPGTRRTSTAEPLAPGSAATPSPSKSWVASRGIGDVREEEEEDTSVLLERMKEMVEGMKRRRSGIVDPEAAEAMKAAEKEDEIREAEQELGELGYPGSDDLEHLEEEAVEEDDGADVFAEGEDDEERREESADEEDGQAMDVDEAEEAEVDTSTPTRPSEHTTARLPLKTPHMADLKHVFSTSNASSSTPRYTGVRELFQETAQNQTKTPQLAGVREMYLRARAQDLPPPDYDGLDDMMATPAGYRAKEEAPVQEETDEDVEGIKQQTRFLKQDSVNSTRNALRLAREAEETARNTVNRLGDQSEKLANTERHLDVSKGHSQRAEDKTDELKQLNRSIFRPVITFNKDAKRAAQEAKVQARYEEERDEREKAMMDIRETQNRLGRATTYGVTDNGDDDEGIGGSRRMKTGAQLSLRQEQRKRFQFESTASDDEMEDELDDNLDEISDMTKRLKALGSAMGQELDKQNNRIERIEEKTVNLDNRVFRNTEKHLYHKPSGFVMSGEQESDANADFVHWDKLLEEQSNIYRNTVSKNATLEARVEELERELSVWKGAFRTAETEQKTLKRTVTLLERNIDSMKDDNPLLLCLIDGDGTIFTQNLWCLGQAGGRQAAMLLTKGITDHVAGFDETLSARSQLWLSMYCNKKGLMETLVKNECLRVFSRFPQVSRVYFGGTHDNGYTSTLHFLENEGLLSKVVLLRGYSKLANELQALNIPYLDIDGLFMTQKLQTNYVSKLTHAHTHTSPSATPPTEAQDTERLRTVHLNAKEPPKGARTLDPSLVRHPPHLVDIADHDLESRLYINTPRLPVPSTISRNANKAPGAATATITGSPP
ncbi:hypothetical protein EWM64_g8246 [Hericium alpestre]|uniref:t-SNARE coiled-coil homology domain-containing protein n=1 Tax=Hericium alpestre TaxID=135208 RepID=A0A4Y9ZP32_9AGAM|nr:hypothetical protein EWM64_g8246 [Hericium alpestre]